MTSHTTPAKTITVTAANGRTFIARIIDTGDRYGAWDALTGEFPLVNNLTDGPMVEFYDTTHMFTPYGQFTGGRYMVETALGRDSYGSDFGALNLNGGEPAWQIDAVTMTVVRNWLLNLFPAPRNVYTEA